MKGRYELPSARALSKRGTLIATDQQSSFISWDGKDVLAAKDLPDSTYVRAIDADHFLSKKKSS